MTNRHARASDEPPNNEPSGPVERLLGDWIATLKAKPQRRIVDQLGAIMHHAIADGVSVTDVADALRLWQDRVRADAKIGPGVLTAIIHQVSQRDPTPTGAIVLPYGRASPPRESTTDRRVHDNAALIHQLRAEREARHGTG